tara:strand:- start:296 stop:583 length:288 start_codon:yes stop_codon:yes gene_type:complete
MSKSKITWSEEASESFERIALNVLKKWNYKTAKEFDTKVDEYLTGLKSNPKMCQASKKNKIRKCVISKQTSLVYRIKKDTIELLLFIDNSSNHSY